MARLSALSRQIEALAGNLQGQFRSEAIAQFARQQLREAEDHNARILGRAPAHTTIVDGRRDAPEESIRPGGTIVYLFEVGQATLEDAVDEAFNLLVNLSPYREKRPNANPPTHYRDEFRLYVNGDRRDFADLGRAVTFAGGDEVWITNLQPYARKIERGWSSQAPNGVVETVMAIIRAKYGSVLSVKFSYRQFPGLAVGRTQRGGTPKTRAEVRRAESYPTLILTVK